MITVFDKKSEFNKKIKPILSELLLKCSEASIPVFVSFAIKGDESKTDYYNDMISPSMKGMTLKNNQLAEFVNILNGFYTVPEKKDFTLDYETAAEEV